jgi:hypothetical protein
MKYMRFFCIVILALFIFACQNNINQKNLILTGWGIDEKNTDKFIADAREVGFDELITWSTDPDFLKKTVEAGDRNNIKIFSCITPMDELRGLWDKAYPEQPLPWQVITEDEAELTFFCITLVDYINYH